MISHIQCIENVRLKNINSNNQTPPKVSQPKVNLTMGKEYQYYSTEQCDSITLTESQDKYISYH